MIGQISRTTFYKYFEDKYDLIGYGMDEFIEIVENDIQSSTTSTSFQIVAYHYYRNKLVFKRLLTGGGDEEVLKIINTSIYKYVKYKLDIATDNGNIIFEPTEIAARTLTAGICQLLNSWVCDELIMSEDEMAMHLEKLFLKYTSEESLSLN